MQRGALAKSLKAQGQGSSHDPSESLLIFKHVNGPNSLMWEFLKTGNNPAASKRTIKYILAHSHDERLTEPDGTNTGTDKIYRRDTE